MSGWSRFVPALRDLQSAFAGAVVYGHTEAIAPFIVANGLDPARRVAVYANNVRENALATLEASFPVLVRLAGRDWVRQTATAYLRRHPSSSGNLHYLGARVMEFNVFGRMRGTGLSHVRASTCVYFFVELLRLRFSRRLPQWRRTRGTQHADEPAPMLASGPK